MSYTNLPFIFGEAEGITSKDFVLRLPLGINDKPALLAAYAEAGHFPEYFGNNWDALNDCLRDFSWLEQKRIVIVHEDLPLASREDDLRIYLEILETAMKDWKKIRRGPFVEAPKEMLYVEHELIVSFPSAVEAATVRMLGPRKS